MKYYLRGIPIKKQSLVIPFAVGASLITHSCTRLLNESSQTRVTLTLPKKIATLSVLTNSGESHWGLPAPTNLETLDCYAIAVTADDLGQSQCQVVGQNELFKISRLYGQYAEGSTIELEVPSGLARTFSVIGFHSTNGSCQNVLNSTFNSKNFSNPLVIGSKTTDLKGEDTTVSIKVSLTDSKPIESCQGSATFGNLPNQYWPPAHCTPTISQISSNGTTLNIQGSCLAGVQSLILNNQTTNTQAGLRVETKSDTSIAATLLANFQLRLDQTLQLLIQTAHGQTAVPFVLTLGPNSVPLQAIDTTGANVGQVLQINSSGQAQWATLSSGGSATNMIWYKVRASGNFIGEVKWPGPVNELFTGPDAVTHYHSSPDYTTSYFSHNIVVKPTNYTNFSLKEAYYSGAGTFLDLYFTGTGCTGDLVIRRWDATSQATISGGIFAYPTGCDTQSNTCSGLQYKSIDLTTQPSFESNITVNSQIQYFAQNSPSSNHVTCVPPIVANNSVRGWLVPSSKISTLPSPPPNAVITNITFEK